MIRPEKDDRVLFTDGAAGDIGLAGFEVSAVAMDRGDDSPPVRDVHHIHLEPHPVHDGVWYALEWKPSAYRLAEVAR